MERFANRTEQLRRTVHAEQSYLFRGVHRLRVWLQAHLEQDGIDSLAAFVVAQQSEVTDAHKPPGQYMAGKTAQEYPVAEHGGLVWLFR